MVRTNFENLRVYQLSEELADAIRDIAVRWDAFDKSTLGIQIVRSADSIGANIAEGSGRYGTADNKRFGYIARGSLYETKHWLRRAFKRDLLTEDDVQRLKPITEELGPKLNAYINSLKLPVRQKLNGDEQRATNDEQSHARTP